VGFFKISIDFFIFTYIAGNLMLNSTNNKNSRSPCWWKKIIFEKCCWKHPPLPTILIDFIWIFSYSHLSSPYKLYTLFQ